VEEFKIELQTFLESERHVLCAEGLTLVVIRRKRVVSSFKRRWEILPSCACKRSL